MRRTTQTAVKIDFIVNDTCCYRYPDRQTDEDYWKAYQFDRNKTTESTNLLIDKLIPGNYYLQTAEPNGNKYDWTMIPISEEVALRISSYKKNLHKKTDGGGAIPLPPALTFLISICGEHEADNYFNYAVQMFNTEDLTESQLRIAIKMKDDIIPQEKIQDKFINDILGL